MTQETEKSKIQMNTTPSGGDMKYWNDLDGSTFFCMVFSGQIAINEIKLFSLIVDNNLSTLTLAFDIRELPNSPPQKWQQAQYNACRIGISCSEIDNLVVRSLPVTGPMKLTIEKDGSRFVVSAMSEHSAIKFTTSFLSLRDPSVYLTKTPF